MERLNIVVKVRTTLSVILGIIVKIIIPLFIVTAVIVLLVSVSEVNSKLKELHEKQDIISSELDNVKEDVSSIYKEIDVIKNNLDGIVERVEGLETDTDSIHKNFEDFKEDVTKKLSVKETKSSTGSKEYTGVISYTQSEFDYFCRLIMGESGGEKYAQNLADATVVVNRVLSDKFPNTLMGVMKQKGQFFGRTDRKPTENVKRACKEALSGTLGVPRHVLFFWSNGSSWSGRTFYKQIGSHYYFS